MMPLFSHYTACVDTSLPHIIQSVGVSSYLYVDASFTPYDTPYMTKLFVAAQQLCKINYMDAFNPPYAHFCKP